MKKLIKFGYDDWHHLYLNGKSIESGHTIETLTVMKVMKENDLSPSDYVEIEAKDQDVNDMYDNGQCPDNLSDIVEDYDFD